MNTVRLQIFGWTLLLALSGCGGNTLNEGEDFGNLLNTSQGLTLNQDKHPIGWQQSQCTLCHNLENIHLVNRTGTSVDIVAIHDRAINKGISDCVTCHGNNGIP